MAEKNELAPTNAQGSPTNVLFGRLGARGLRAEIKGELDLPTWELVQLLAEASTNGKTPPYDAITLCFEAAPGKPLHMGRKKKRDSWMTSVKATLPGVFWGTPNAFGFEIGSKVARFAGGRWSENMTDLRDYLLARNRYLGLSMPAEFWGSLPIFPNSEISTERDLLQKSNQNLRNLIENNLASSYSEYSPRHIAEATGVSPSNATYHLRCLAKSSASGVVQKEDRLGHWRISEEGFAAACARIQAAKDRRKK